MTCKLHGIAECATCTGRPQGTCDYGACWKKSSKTTGRLVNGHWTDFREFCSTHYKAARQADPGVIAGSLSIDTSLKSRYPATMFHPLDSTPGSMVP